MIPLSGYQNMQIQLTKDQDKFICEIYRQYLTKIKVQTSKRSSRRFTYEEFSKSNFISSFSKEDVDFTLMEIAQKNLIQIYLGGDFDLTDSGIYYMENRFKNGLIEVTDFIAKFIP